MQQQLDDLRAGQQTQADALHAALQAEVAARRAAEATAGELRTQADELKDDLAEFQNRLQIMVRLSSS